MIHSTARFISNTLWIILVLLHQENLGDWVGWCLCFRLLKWGVINFTLLIWTQQGYKDNHLYYYLTFINRYINVITLLLYSDWLRIPNLFSLLFCQSQSVSNGKLCETRITFFLALLWHDLCWKNSYKIFFFCSFFLSSKVCRNEKLVHDGCVLAPDNVITFISLTAKWHSPYSHQPYLRLLNSSII